MFKKQTMMAVSLGALLLTGCGGGGGGSNEPDKMMTEEEVMEFLNEQVDSIVGQFDDYDNPMDLIYEHADGVESGYFTANDPKLGDVFEVSSGDARAFEEPDYNYLLKAINYFNDPKESKETNYYSRFMWFDGFANPTAWGHADGAVGRNFALGHFKNMMVVGGSFIPATGGLLGYDKYVTGHTKVTYYDEPQKSYATYRQIIVGKLKASVKPVDGMTVENLIYETTPDPEWDYVIIQEHTPPSTQITHRYIDKEKQYEKRIRVYKDAKALAGGFYTERRTKSLNKDHKVSREWIIFTASNEIYKHSNAWFEYNYDDYGYLTYKHISPNNDDWPFTTEVGSIDNPLYENSPKMVQLGNMGDGYKENLTKGMFEVVRCNVSGPGYVLRDTTFDTITSCYEDTDYDGELDTLTTYEWFSPWRLARRTEARTYASGSIKELLDDARFTYNNLGMIHQVTHYDTNGLYKGHESFFYEKCLTTKDHPN